MEAKNGILTGWKFLGTRAEAQHVTQSPGKTWSERQLDCNVTERHLSQNRVVSTRPDEARQYGAVARDQKKRKHCGIPGREKGEESRSDYRKRKMKETRRSKDMGCAGCRKTALVWTGGVKEEKRLTTEEGRQNGSRKRKDGAEYE